MAAQIIDLETERDQAIDDRESLLQRLADLLSGAQLPPPASSPSVTASLAHSQRGKRQRKISNSELTSSKRSCSEHSSPSPNFRTSNFPESKPDTPVRFNSYKQCGSVAGNPPSNLSPSPPFEDSDKDDISGSSSDQIDDSLLAALSSSRSASRRTQRASSPAASPSSPIVVDTPSPIASPNRVSPPVSISTCSVNRRMILMTRLVSAAKVGIPVMT